MNRPPRHIGSRMMTLERFLTSIAQGTVILGMSLLSYWLSLDIVGNSAYESNAIAFGTIIIGNLSLIVVNRSQVSCC